jgi:hypothetical protein
MQEIHESGHSKVKKKKEKKKLLKNHRKID